MANEPSKPSGAVKVLAPRETGWTKKARVAFLTELARTCNVSSSCRSVGRSTVGLYALRYRDPAFAAEWDAALEQGYGRLEAELLSRALGDVDAQTTCTEDGDARECGEDGDTAECEEAVPITPFDAGLALMLLAQRRGAEAKGRRPRYQLRQPTRVEVMAELDRRLTAMEKRVGIRPRLGGAS